MALTQREVSAIHVREGTAAQRPTYIGLPSTGWGSLVHFGNSVLQNRVLFASRWPLLPFRRTVEEINELPLKPEVKEKWLGGNASALLGFEDGA